MYKLFILHPLFILDFPLISIFFKYFNSFRGGKHWKKIESEKGKDAFPVSRSKVNLCRYELSTEINMPFHSTVFF